MVNKVILIGNVGMDPEVRTTEGGVKVARLRLATTERLFDRQANETRDQTVPPPGVADLYRGAFAYPRLDGQGQ